MKSISLILFLFLFGVVDAQPINSERIEEVLNFTSVLIDYEIHQDKVVAITKKNREYFVYYENEKGEKLFESIEIFFATDLEIDCMGNLFLVGLDSAIQLEVSESLKRVQTLDFETYKANIRTCKALFEESLVRESFNNSLIYEPLDDSIYARHPVLFTIQIWSNGFVSPGVNSRDLLRMSTKDATLSDNRQINIRNDQLAMPHVPRSRGGNMSRTGRSYGVASELSAFQVGDSLWVIDENNELLFVYNEYGKSDGVKEIEGLPVDFRLCQDRVTQEVYFLYNDGGSRRIRKLDENGELAEGVLFYKGFSKSSLKISNGYLYFRDSKGAGEFIKRVQLN